GSRSIVDVSASSTRKLSAPCLSGSTGEAGNDHGLGKGTRSWSMNGYHYYDLESTTLFFQRNRVKRNRMRESCSYGSVRERGGNEPLYSETFCQNGIIPSKDIGEGDFMAHFLQWE